MNTILILLIYFILSTNLNAGFYDEATVILGRPTNSSIAMNILAKKTLEFFVEFGTESGNYTGKTSNYSATFPEPAEFSINNLEPNQKYYYRIQYREKQDEQFIAGDECFFHTQRAKGSSFTFTIQSDAHLYDKKGIKTVMEITMKNQARDSADFVLDLGDTFGDDHNPFTITDEELKQLHLDYLPFFGMLCHSSPLFLCLGNHEGESGYYLLQNPPNNLAAYATKWRTKYYPNPYPDGFYTGNEDVEPFSIGRPQNYYAFEWGDALFVVLDVYRYYTANEKPKKWDWTIGDKQYVWFKNTLESSNAKFKFVFAHHTLGQGRGGAIESMLYEWGGWEDTKKSKWGFEANRPGWEKPIHNLMVDNGVQVYFQGHDHLYAMESVDGMIYQEMPMPSDSTYQIGMLANADAYTGVTLDGTGYLRVRIAENKAYVDYVKTYLPHDENDSLKNGMVGYSYTVSSNPVSVKDNSFDEPEMIFVSPNPANDYAEINISRVLKESSILNVYNAIGEIVFQSGYQHPGFRTSIDLSGLPDGLYFVRYGNFVQKLFVVR